MTTRIRSAILFCMVFVLFAYLPGFRVGVIKEDLFDGQLSPCLSIVAEVDHTKGSLAKDLPFPPINWRPGSCIEKATVAGQGISGQ